MSRLSLAMLVALCTWPRFGAAEELTLARALELARERAPASIAARERIHEARGQLAGAAPLLQENPTIEVAYGPRSSGDGESWDLDLGIHQPLAFGRSARVAGAEAAVRREHALAEQTTRLLLRDVVAAFARALHARERLSLAIAAEQVAGEMARSTERRHLAGELPVLDANLARAAHAQARADVHAATAADGEASSELRVLLGLDAATPLVPAGRLSELAKGDVPAGAAAEQPALEALRAELQEAKAQEALGDAMAWPQLGLGVTYEREADERIVLGGVSLTLPLFARGQELRAVGRARARRLRGEIEALEQRLAVRAESTRTAYTERVRAVELLEQDALPLLQENESLARRSYDAGEMSIADWLLIRRETLASRINYLDRLLEAAEARAAFEALIGALR